MLRPALRALAGLVVVVTLMLAGCAGPPSAPPPGPPASPPPPPPGPDQPVEVLAVGSRCGECFQPAQATVRAGQQVRWTVESGSHTVTFERSVDGNATAPESGNLDSGQTYEVAFPGPGTFAYRCKYHSSGFGAGKGMVGTVVVS